MAKQYISKYGKVWQRIKTDDILGNALVLEEDESLLEFRQISDPNKEKTKEKEINEKTRKNRNTELSFENIEN